MELIIFGSKEDKVFSKELVDVIKNKYKTFYYDGKNLEGIKKPQINIIETDKEVNVNSKKCICVLKEDADVNELKKMKNIPILVWSTRLNQIKQLSKLGLYAVPCGVSQKDTFTFSSMGVENTVISLQREFMGNSPMEIPINKMENISRFCLLCLAAITMLFDKKSEYEI